MKETKRSAACWAGAALVLLFGLIVALSACMREEYDFSSTVIHTDASTARSQTDFSALAGVYKSEFVMTEPVTGGAIDETTSIRLRMYLMITEDGSFAFSNKLEFDNAAYGAGSLGLYLDQEPVFIYFAMNNKSVNTGSRVSRYEVGSNGEIRFLSTMWYGGRAPSAETEEGTVFPTFMPYYAPDARDLTMGQEAEQVIASIRAEITTYYRNDYRASTAVRQSTDASDAETTTEVTTEEGYTTNPKSNVKYTYKYTPGVNGTTRESYTYTMPTVTKKQSNKTTAAPTTQAEAVTTTAAPTTAKPTTKAATTKATTTTEPATDPPTDPPTEPTTPEATEES